MNREHAKKDNELKKKKKKKVVIVSFTPSTDSGVSGTHGGTVRTTNSGREWSNQISSAS